MLLQARVETQAPGPSPKVYSANSLPHFWVAEGTDGYFYKVPNEPGGWVQCSAAYCEKYDGQPQELKPLPPEEARSVVWFVYGDVGAVTIAEV